MKCPNAACAAWTTHQDAVVDHESEPGRRHVFRCPWCGYRWGKDVEQDVDLDRVTDETQRVAEAKSGNRDSQG